MPKSVLENNDATRAQSEYDGDMTAATHQPKIDEEDILSTPRRAGCSFYGLFLSFAAAFLVANTLWCYFPKHISVTPLRDQQRDTAKCSDLAPRSSKPLSARDVRVDDIGTIIGLGDSITAAFAAKGVLKDRPEREAYEYRGVSYIAGGDLNATTVANLIKRYSPNLFGASIQSHPVEFCYGFLCPPFQYWPELDRLNGAQSGSMAINLRHQLDDYILPQLDSYRQKITWTFVNIQIGSNDLCMGCEAVSAGVGFLAPDMYEAILRDTVDAIRAEIPRVIVNLVGVFNVSQVYDKTHNQPYCERFDAIPHFNLECPCALLAGPIGIITRNRMDNLAVEYNKRIKKIVESYQSDNAFGLRHIDMMSRLDLSTWPMEALSDWDCFHPSELAHAYLAKLIWNEVFGRGMKQDRISWQDPRDISLDCIQDGDRVRLG